MAAAVQYSKANFYETTPVNSRLVTIPEIVAHVILGEPYRNQPLLENVKTSKVYQILAGAASEPVIQQVRQFANGELSLKDIENQITPQSAYLYLAASKIVDLESNGKSTYEIRMAALKSSELEKDGSLRINALNAFSLPPTDADDCDLLLLNELDNAHPSVKKAGSTQERNELLTKIYNYGQHRARILPELSAIIADIVKTKIFNLKLISKHLPEHTTLIFRGCSGAGKSHEIHQLMKKLALDQTAEDVIQSTDSIKTALRKTMKNLSDEQVHLAGFCIFKVLSEAMKVNYPELSTIEEGWFQTLAAIEQLFKNNPRLEIHDFDGTYSAICLRVLARQSDPNSPRPPSDRVEAAFKSSRESRARLLELLRKDDTYSFTFVNSDGQINNQADPRVIPKSPKEVDQEIEESRKMIITSKHAEIFGPFLNNFIGMTISEAFERARRM